MTTTFDKTSLGGRAARAAVFGLLALAATLLPTREARAQWTQPDAAGNINSTNTGKVGIGTTTPPYAVTVVKDQVGSTVVGVFNSTDGPGTVTSMGTGRTLDFSDKYLTFGVTAPSFGVPGLNDTGIMHSKGVTLKFGSESAHDLHFFTNGYNNTRMMVSGGGNVGIGTTNPASAKLVVSSNAATPFAPQPGTILHLVNADATKTRLNIDSFGYGGEPSVTFRSARGTAAAPSATLAGDRLAILHGTGFGTTQFMVGAKPNIVMQATENWSDAAAGSAITFSTVANGTTTPAERLRVNSDGNVGIGTASPARVLDVQGAQGGVRLTTTTNGYGSVVELKSAAAAPTLLGAINFVNASDLARGQIAYAAGDVMTFNTGSVERMRLDAAGNLTVTGNLSAKYQDVAEWVPSTQRLAAGTVVVVDAGGVNHVLASTAAYDTGVAGVISAQPGLLLGEGGEGQLMVATTGRVKVRVDATRAPIRAGDLLVTSGVEGVAMRSEPVSFGGVAMHRPGTIIGKALESLESGTGEILVLLSLQ